MLSRPLQMNEYIATKNIYIQSTTQTTNETDAFVTVQFNIAYISLICEEVIGYEKAFENFTKEIVNSISILFISARKRLARQKGFTIHGEIGKILVLLLGMK